MSSRIRNRAWCRLNPDNIRTRSSASEQETSQDTRYHSSILSSSSSSAASGERGWDYLLRRKAENINDRIHKAKAAGVGGTTQVFSQFPIKEEPISPQRNESNPMYSLSQMTPSLFGMDASQRYVTNEGFWVDTTGEGYREQGETQQTLSRFVHSQERPSDHYIKTEAPWDDYPETTVESYGILHSSEDTGHCYGISSTAYQLSDQTASQSLPNDREGERYDTKQGLKRKFNVISNSLSVQTLVANIRNAVATNPNFKRRKHDSAANQRLGHNEPNGIDDASCTSEPSFMENNWFNHQSEQTPSHHMSSVVNEFQQFTELSSKGNGQDSVTNQTLACNTLNVGRDVNHTTKQGFGRNKPNSASNRTSIHTLSYPAEGVEVVYTVDPVEAEAWLRNNIVDCSAQAVGFDIEWKPQFVSKKKGGVENKTAVLQLGVESSCLVLHLCNMKSPPKLLRSILNDKKILKVGSGILLDVAKLKRDTGLICLGLVDTQKMAKSVGNAPQKLGLQALAEHFLGINLDKPKTVSKSNWEKYPLTIRQIHYAALDAWIGFKIYQHMKSAIGPGQAHTIETQLLADEPLEKSVGAYTLPYPAEGVEVVYTADSAEAETWLRNNIIDCSAQAVGFDIKWKLQQEYNKKDGVENKTAILQLGVESSCMVLHLSNMKSPPELLRSILNDKEILKVGKAIRQDIKKLQRDTGLTCKGTVDTQEMAKSLGTNAPKKLGIKALANHFLGINLGKPKSLSRSNWGRYPLTVKQIHFAALDAWIVFKIYQQLKLAKGQHQTPIGETQLVDDKAQEKSVEILKCFVCKKKFKSQDALSKHIKLHPQCKCGMIFPYKISRKHRKVCPELNPVAPPVQADDNSTLHCQACGKKCASAERLMTHIRDMGHVQCPFCTRLLNGPQCTSHIRRCKQFSGQWTQKQAQH